MASAARIPVVEDFDPMGPALVEFARRQRFRRIGVNAYADGRIIAEGWWDAGLGKRGHASGHGTTPTDALEDLTARRANADA